MLEKAEYQLGYPVEVLHLNNTTLNKYLKIVYLRLAVPDDLSLDDTRILLDDALSGLDFKIIGFG